MAKTIGTSELAEVWGSDRVGQGADPLVTPVLGTIEKGFVDGIASANDFTWVPNVLGEKLNHVLRNGIAAWTATTAYLTGCCVTHSGAAWVATANNTNSTPSDGNANWAKLLTAQNSQVVSIAGPPPTWQSATTVRIPAGAKLADDTGTKIINVTANLDIVLSGSSTGALALDTGTEANSTWYYVWLCEGTSGVTAVFSASSTSPTLPTGYTSFKRLLPFAVRNDASGNLIPFGNIIGWTGGQPFVPWDVARTFYQDGTGFTGGTARVVAAGTATSWTDVTCAAFVPPVSRRAGIALLKDGVTYNGFRPNGASHTGIGSQTVSGNELFDIDLDASQIFEYIRWPAQAGNIHADVTGFYVTEA